MEKTIKYTLFIGLNDMNKKRQIIPTFYAKKIITKTILNYTDGATIYKCNGIFRHENGTIIKEKSFKIEFFGVDDVIINSIISDLKIKLNQEAIIKQIDIIESEFC